jgi:hypothetical protein
MKHLKKINEAEAAKIDSKTLRTVLWDKGWKQYFDAEDKLRKKLNSSYQSVSNLPEGTTEAELEKVSDTLVKLAAELNRCLMFIG